MAAGFEDFTRAAGVRRTSAPVAQAPFSRFAVLGGGTDARALAALCLAENNRVVLFSAYGQELDALRASAGVTLLGDGPIGSYHAGTGDVAIELTPELDAAVRDAEVLFLTGPLHKQRTYAMVLAGHLKDGQVLVLAAGRSLGAVETAWLLRMGGCTADITIVECQGLPYWLKAEGTRLTLSKAAPMPTATLPRGRETILDRLAPVLGEVLRCDSVLGSSFADLSAAVDIPALILGGPGLRPGGIPIPMGAQSLPANTTFAALIGPDQRTVIDAVANERRTVAKAYGVRNLPQTDDWITCFAGQERGAGHRPVPHQTEAAQMLRDGVIGSLVPLVSAADLAGLPVPRTQSLITLAETLLGADVAASGRRLDTVGVREGDVDSARRTFDALMENR